MTIQSPVDQEKDGLDVLCCHFAYSGSRFSCIRKNGIFGQHFTSKTLRTLHFLGP